MTIFGVPEARYYCRGFKKIGGASCGSLGDYISTYMRSVPSLKEGSSGFDEYRDCSLREAERCLFLAVSNYRRALDLMMPGSSNWSHVTLYYSSYFSARALLGMFGGWIGNKLIIEASSSSPGNQELRINKKPQTTYAGSHERFWDHFYAAMAQLLPWMDPKLRFAISPVAGRVTWQSENRNDLNYDSFMAFQLASNFQLQFKPVKFPVTLPGRLSTQYAVTEGLLLITTRFVKQFSLVTDGLDILTPAGPRKIKLERLVFRDRPPQLVSRTKWKSFKTVIDRKKGPIMEKQTRRGEIVVKLDVESDTEFYRLHTFFTKEPETIAWIESKLFAPGDVFYDIGANIGVYTLYARAFHKDEIKIYAFEPVYHNFQKLCKNIILNKVDSGVVPYCVAIGNRTAIKSMTVDFHDPGSSKDLNLSSSGNTLKLQQGCVTASLDDLVYEYLLSSPAHIKIDTDGAEENIIQGAQRVLRAKTLKSVLIEITDKRGVGSGIEKVMVKNGFTAEHPLNKRLNHSRTRREDEGKGYIKNVIYTRA